MKTQFCVAMRPKMVTLSSSPFSNLIFFYNLLFSLLDEGLSGNHRSDSSSNNSTINNANNNNNRNLNYSTSSNNAILTALSQNSTSVQPQSEHPTHHNDNSCSATSNVANLYEYKSSNNDLIDESNSNKLNFNSNSSSSTGSATAAANAYMNSCLMFKNNLELLANGNTFANSSPQNCTYVELQSASLFNCQLPTIDSLGPSKGTYA